MVRIPSGLLKWKNWVFVYVYIQSPLFQKDVFFEIINKDLVYGSNLVMFHRKVDTRGEETKELNLSINGHRV